MSDEVMVRFSGPLFGPNGPAQVREAVNLALQDLVSLGEQHLASRAISVGGGGVFRYEHRKATARYLNSIHGEVMADLRGRIDLNKEGKPLIYGAWIEGTSSRNQTTRFKGYALFRLTAQWLQEQAGKVGEARLRQLVARLGGA